MKTRRWRLQNLICLFNLFVSIWAIGSLRLVTAAESMYWIETEAQVKSANVDGSNVQTLLNLTPDRAGGIAIDQLTSKMYVDVVVTHGAGPSTGEIFSANLDGTGMQSLVTTNLGNEQSSPRAIALDVTDGKMYWADATDFGHSGTINRANLDGTDVQTLINYSWPDDLALDLAHGKIYWSDYNNGRILDANLDGSGIQTVISNANTTYGFALDVPDNKIFYNEIVNGGRVIATANLNGSNQTTLLTGFTDIRGMAVDQPMDKLYWLNAGSQSIQRSNLDGTDIEDLVTAGLYYPINIAIVPEPSAIVLAVLGFGSMCLYFVRVRN